MSAVDDTSADTQHQPPSAATNATTHDTTTTSSSSSIFVPDDAPVYDMPVSAINRPLQSVVDADKVQRFVADMQAGSVFTPIEVVHVQEGGQHYYFAFGGCHRWAAVKQLGRPTIQARLIQVSPATINTYLGASSPFNKRQQQVQEQLQLKPPPDAA